MRSVAMLLTALLSVLLTTSVPAALEECCQPKASCCSGQCDCHMSSPVKPPSATEMPPTPTIDHLFFCHPERNEGPRNRIAAEVLRCAQNDNLGIGAHSL